MGLNKRELLAAGLAGLGVAAAATADAQTTATVTYGPVNSKIPAGRVKTSRSTRLSRKDATAMAMAR